MRAQRTAHRPTLAARQRGQAFLISVLLIVVGAAALVYSMVSPNRDAIERDKQTAAALAQARDALIGYAAAISGGSTRPGELPCPATDVNGIAGTSCNTLASRIGRLPWKTLGLADLRDGHGEILWYAVSNNFKNNTRVYPLNSDTAGEFSVTTGTVQVDGAIALLIAPGPVVGTQQRDGAANQANIANYLEGDNANGDAVFTTDTVPGSRNDRLLAITSAHFFPAVEQRVAREMRKNLQDYYAANRYYPFASPFTGTACTEGTYRGRMPVDACPAPMPALTLPPWFAQNNWNQVMTYAVAPRCTPRIETVTTTSWAPWPSNIGGCFWVLFFWLCPITTTTTDIDSASLDCNHTAAGPYLTATDGSSTIEVEALILSAGWGLGSQTRPCATASNCLEDPENTDDPDDYAYVRPVRSPANNDNLVIVNPPGL
ncbi:MAG: hypothetical protein KIT18_12940 [Burkholderiales bacterium]|nr:hypothetical protein [Burkholderiales bacterium]